MPDPFSVYAGESASKRDLLRQIWPDLHAVLDERVNIKRRTPPQCAAAVHADRQPATGRISLNGAPACSLHLRTLSDRPEGYPLDIVDPRTWDGSR